MRLAVAIIAIDRGQVLLVRNAKRCNSVEIPGGGVLHRETVFDAAKRELWEECGLRTEPDDFVRFDDKDAHGWHVCLMRALRWSGTLRAGDDAESVFWDSPELILTGQRPEDHAYVLRCMGGT